MQRDQTHLHPCLPRLPVTAAQQANEWDMAGHAQKAKDLLDQVNSELKLAAQAANKNAK